jgi:hypothetical protein
MSVGDPTGGRRDVVRTPESRRKRSVPDLTRLSVEFANLLSIALGAWETDGDGRYDVRAARPPECRGRVRAAVEGTYAFRAVLPVSYSIPTDGPVGALMRRFLSV